MMNHTGATRTLVVWCADWPVVAARLERGNDGAGESPLAGRPVAVVAANQVVACSEEARAEGVRPGLRRRQAEASCPQLVVIAEDPARDARTFEPVVAAVESLAPGVEVVHPGACAVATRGPSRYFGGDRSLATRVEEVVGSILGPGRGRGRGRVGIADSRFAAEQAARAGVVVPPGDSADFLAPLPVATLGRPDLADLLARLGIRTLGQLAAMPSAAVLGRFGPEGATAHRLARGLDERPLAARTPPEDLAVSTALDPPVDQVDTATFAAKALADQLYGLLERRGLAAASLRIEAETEHGEQLSRLWRHDAALGPAAVAERVRWQLEGWMSSPGRPTAGLVLLRLAPGEVAPAAGRQLGFWGADAAAGERVARALARVQGMLGPEAVVTGRLLGGRSPADQVRLVAWADLPADPDARLPGVPPWPGRLPTPSPATVHVPARPAQVTDAGGAPVRVDGRGAATADPARLSVDGDRWVEVVAWAGPWPVDERWWDPSDRRRRARWQMVSAGGEAHLLILEGGRWLVEATYD